MKNLTLILIALVLSLSASAQKLDKNLIYGKWRAISIKMNDLEINSKDKAATLKTLYTMAAKQGATEEQLAAMDTTELLSKLDEMFEQLNKCKIEFNKNGTMKASLDFGKDDAEEVTGKFEWVGDNKLRSIEENRNTKDSLMVVVTLTKDRFVFTPDETENETVGLEMTFERE